MTEFHNVDTGVGVIIDPHKVEAYSPTWDNGHTGTTVRLSDNSTVRLRESFKEFHAWIDPTWSPRKRTKSPVPKS